MPAHFTSSSQPDGFDALEAETDGFAEIVLAHWAPAVRAGDRIVMYNTPLRHLAAVVTVVAESYWRTVRTWSDGRFAVATTADVVSDRGPAFRDVRPGRANPRSIDDELLARCEKIVSRNRRRPEAARR